MSTLLLIGGVLFIATPAHATQLLPKHHKITNLPLRNQANWYRKNIHHAKTTLRWWADQRTALSTDISWKRFRYLDIAFHERLLTNATRNLRGVERRLHLRSEQQRRSAALRTTPAHYLDWLCIHRYEGAWNDPNAPYYGGLQMDWAFMHNYGAELLATKGTADHWTPLEQMQVAEKGLKVQGWGAWPNTARMCGLL